MERIKVGDEVLSRNWATGKLEYKPVTALTKPHRDRLLELRIEGERDLLRPSLNHPFWVKRGEAKDGDWIEAGNMQVGDLVQNIQGNWRKVVAITPVGGQQTVYNFEVDDNHDYFVGSTGLLVHNYNCPRLRGYQKTFFGAYPELEGQVQVHHAIEQQVLKNYPGLFTEQELNALDNLRGIPNDIAGEIHQSLIRELWDDFYNEFPPGVATQEDFIFQRNAIDAELGQYFDPVVGGGTE